jgi:hypothetical protein
MALGGTYRKDRSDPQCEPLDGWDVWDEDEERAQDNEADARLQDMEDRELYRTYDSETE